MNHQHPPYGQAPPPNGPPYYQQGPPPQGAPPGQQPPHQQQPSYGYNQPPPGQYPPPGQQQPGQYQYQNQPYPGQYQSQPYPPPGNQPGAPLYGHQPPPHGQPPIPGAYGQQAPYQQQQQSPYPQQYNVPPPGQQQQQQHWQQPPLQNYNIPPTPASPGYDAAQKQWVQPVNTASDIEAIRKAMKGMGCDEKALIRVFADPKYSNPWAMAQLIHDYNSRFIRDLSKDIESETRGDLETGLLALVRGPLENDVRVLQKALVRAGTDEEALMDVLLCRSNADLRAISAEYRRLVGRELLVDIKDDVDDSLYRLYSMVLGANRAEDAAPVNPIEIDQKVTELQRATEGTIGANAIAVAQVFTSSNDAQIHAMSDAYQRKYHRSLEDVIEKEFRGDMEDALLRMLTNAMDRPRADADRLRAPLLKTLRKDRLFINRLTSLYWDRPRLDAAKATYKKRYGRPFSKEVKEMLSGDYERLMLALLGES